MTKYLIKLKPMDDFFFGQENKYRRKFNGGNISIEPDYFQVSALFPQQTTLLGMLRYYLLLINNQIPITNEGIAKELIGDKSFDLNVKSPSFGMINKITPVFIVKDDDIYILNPKDLILPNDGTEYLKAKDYSVKNNLRSNFENLFFFENYKEKNGLDKFLLKSENEFLPLFYDKENHPNGVFVKKEKVGITKGDNGKTLDKAFYKQVFYGLNTPYSFGFIAELNEDNFDVKTGFVPMGAEKSIFEISFSKYDGDYRSEINLQNTNKPKIVLLSDTYISDYKPDDYKMAISNTKTFRFIKTEVKKGHKYYSSDPIKGKQIKRSKKLNLIERGSVFYFYDEAQMNAFASKLDSEINFKTIGYNHYIKIN